MWKDRHKPEPLKFEELEAMPEEQTELDGVSRDHTVWSLQKTFTVFCQRYVIVYYYHSNYNARSCLKLGERVKEKAELEFEKDDDEIMDFITAATNLRAHIFGIKPLQSRFQIKEMAGNIIPAIATTNAVIAGFMTLNVVRLTQNLKQQKERLSHGIKTAYLTNNTNGTRLVNAEQLQPPNKECGVCQLEYRQVTANASEATLGGLLETVLRSKLQMLGDLQILRSDGYDT